MARHEHLADIDPVELLAFVERRCTLLGIRWTGAFEDALSREPHAHRGDTDTEYLIGQTFAQRRDRTTSHVPCAGRIRSRAEPGTRDVESSPQRAQSGRRLNA